MVLVRDLLRDDISTLKGIRLRSNHSGCVGTITNVHLDDVDQDESSVDILWDNGNHSGWVFIYLIEDFEIIEED